MAPQSIIINYTPDKRLSLVDETSRTPLYHVKVSRHTPQMEMIRLSPSPSYNEFFPDNEEAYYKSRVCTSQFKMTSLDVRLRIREHHDIVLKRQGLLSTSYSFISPALSSSALTWETNWTQGNLGDFRLVVEAENESARKELAHFRNTVFSNKQVGTFEMDSDLDQLVKDEVVISGLATLAMLQSMNLAGMVMFGGS